MSLVYPNLSPALPTGAGLFSTPNMAGGAISGGPSLHGAGRACPERARRRQPANRRLGDAVRPGEIGLHSAIGEALQFLAWQVTVADCHRVLHRSSDRRLQTRTSVGPALIAGVDD